MVKSRGDVDGSPLKCDLFCELLSVKAQRHTDVYSTDPARLRLRITKLATFKLEEVVGPSSRL